MKTITKEQVDKSKRDQYPIDANHQKLLDTQDEIRRIDPLRSDLSLYVAERLDFIKGNNLFEVLGYKSMTEYLLDSQKLFGIRRSSCYNYLKAYKVIKKYEPFFIQAGLGLGDNRADLIAKGLYTKSLLLEKAMFVKCSDEVSAQDVFDHFLSLSYQEFLYYLYPKKAKEAEWKSKLEGWNKQIRQEFNRTGLVRLINYVPDESIRERIRDIVLNVSKEVN